MGKDNLVTVAIHTFEEAQKVKELLEKNGVEAVIHNVNLEQPTISAGVRVRIKENDLAKALGIIERMYLVEDYQSQQNKILVPVDFSDYSLKACDIAFPLAAKTNAEVILLNVYFNPVYNSIPFLESTPYSIKDDEVLRRIVAQSTADMQNLTNILKRKMETKELPQVAFSTRIQDGIPEEEIIRFSKENNPTMIVMGTRGKDRKELDLIGSVTAEIIERSRVPILTIPEDNTIDFKNIENVAFITNFSDKDLVTFEKLVGFLGLFNPTVHLVYFSNISLNKKQLDSVKAYIEKQYPNLKIKYSTIDEANILDDLDKFIKTNNIDVVSLNSFKRNIFSRLFNPSIARKMIFHTNTPMLIFQS
jgi:nucleotide-binding universal stress UspA family protein